MLNTATMERGLARSERVRFGRMLDEVDAGFERQMRFDLRVDAEERKIWKDSKNSPALVESLLNGWIDATEVLAEIHHEYALFRAAEFKSTNFAAFGLRAARILERLTGNIATQEIELAGDEVEE
jgi:hypothetical protein